MKPIAFLVSAFCLLLNFHSIIAPGTGKHNNIADIHKVQVSEGGGTRESSHEQLHPDTVAARPKCSGFGCFGTMLSSSKKIKSVRTTRSVSYSPSSPKYVQAKGRDIPPPRPRGIDGEPVNSYVPLP